MAECPLCRQQDLFTELKHPGRAFPFWDCGRCGLVFTDPCNFVSPEAEKKRYDLHRNGPEDLGYLDFLRRVAGPLSQRLAKGAAGLDFGSGPGPAMHIVMKDYGFGMRNYDPHYNPDPSLLDARYDFITCTEVAEHLRDPGAEFVLIDKLLKREGWLGIMTGIFYPHIDFSSWWYVKDPTHICFYREKTFTWIAGQRNWDVEFPAANVVLFQKKIRVI